ncbi:hypothetical protein [Alkalihalobacterium elongatum]|uniref:hypothetical protein n=1 Tax=Alkalihalobacterium elongatum TaxID=2675466 RepID=UPI001C1FFCC6|nr:hypothetical protein [Alkalihalobacterium elongatum]
MRIFTVSILFSLLLIGCSFGKYEAKKIDTITQLKPTEEDQYHMFVFFDFPHHEVPDPSWLEEVDEYLQMQYEIYEKMMPILNADLKTDLFGVRNASENQEQIDFLNINEFPTCIILDNTGIVLATTDMYEAAEFLRMLPDTN